MDIIGLDDTPPKSYLRQDRKPRKVRERIEIARVARLVKLVGGDLQKIMAKAEECDDPQLALAARGSLITGIERLHSAMESAPRGIAGLKIAEAVTYATNAVYKAAKPAQASSASASVNIQINLPSGAEARAFLGRLAGERSSRIEAVAPVEEKSE